jgi:hypothetical protein
MRIGSHADHFRGAGARFLTDAAINLPIYNQLYLQGGQRVSTVPSISGEQETL